MTYAREVSEELAAGIHPFEAKVISRSTFIEARILQVIERCAREVEDGCSAGKTKGQTCVGCREAAARIRALATPPAGVGAEATLCKYCVGKELRSVCVKCGRAPVGTGGRR